MKEQEIINYFSKNKLHLETEFNPYSKNFDYKYPVWIGVHIKDRTIEVDKIVRIFVKSTNVRFVQVGGGWVKIPPSIIDGFTNIMRAP